MKCPYCENDMEQGYIQGPRGVFWSAKGRNFFFFPHRVKGDVVIAGAYEGSSGQNAYLCRSCGKIIIDVKYDLNP